jgi:hypothetical protein
LKKKIFLLKLAWFVNDHLLGERNGRKCGRMLSIAVKNAEETNLKSHE